MFRIYSRTMLIIFREHRHSKYILSVIIAMAAILKYLSKIHVKGNLVGTVGSTWGSDLLKSFRSDIEDDHLGSHLEILQTTSPVHMLNQNMTGGIRAKRRFRRAKIVLFQYPKWLSWQSSWFFFKQYRLKSSMSGSTHIRAAWRISIVIAF